MPRSGTTIELSQAQINRVIRGAAEDNGVLALLGGLAGRDFRTYAALRDDQRLSRSLLRGLMVLASFPADGALRSLADVAHQLDLGPSTTHRYVSTLVAIGVLERDPESRGYRLARTG
jgi:DNA-binding MarR family transcriptional regulator